jgi:glycine cleavage system transcriptional repressor
MDKSYAVLTAIGSDRVGIVDDISGLIASEACNIEESRMAVLGGEFAVIMLISGGAASLESLGKALPAHAEKQGLHAELRPTRPPRPMESGRPYHLEAVSLDTPGIVHSVTAVLRKHGVNIEDLETETAAAPWTGAPMFRMKAQIVIMPATTLPRLKEDLSALQESRDVDIILKPLFAAPQEEK